MNNNTYPAPQPHLDIDLLRDAVGPGLQVAVGEQLLHFLSEPAICKN